MSSPENPGSEMNTRSLRRIACIRGSGVIYIIYIISLLYIIVNSHLVEGEGEDEQGRGAGDRVSDGRDAFRVKRSDSQKLTCGV